MNVRELLERLSTANPEAEVLFMQIGADPDEGDAIAEVEAQPELWTFEQGREGGTTYAVYYPGEPEPRGDGYQDVAYRRVSAVLLKPVMPERWKTLLRKS